MDNTENFFNWDDDDDDVTVTPPPVLGSGNSIVDDVSSADTRLETYDSGENFFPPSVLSVSEDEDNPDNGDKLSVVQRTSDGEIVKTVIDFASPPLTKEEAHLLTENIRSATNVLYILIKRAHAGKAWKALGYNSFQAYVKEEIQLSRSYAYRLLDQATIIEAIQAAAPAGTEVFITENASRTLKGSLPELVAEIGEKTEGMSPEDASEIVKDVIAAEQDALNRKDDPFGDEDFGLEEPPYDDDNYGGGDGDYRGDGNYPKQKNPYQDPSNEFDFADDSYYTDEDLAEGEAEDEEDTAYRVQKLERLYNFITSLRSLGEYAEDYNVEELFEILPEDREEDITRLLEIDIEWLKDVQSRWKVYLTNKPEISSPLFNDDEDDDI